MEPLDRPVWSALTSGWRWLAEGDGAALRQDRRYGPFAAARDDGREAQAALAALIPPGESLWLLEPEPLAAPPLGCVVTRSAAVAQMVLDALALPTARDDIMPLGEADAPEMRALAALTRPGPFHVMTHVSGRFLGIRVDGRLAAMAGERMRLTGHAEVSGVCTHPEFRGRGHAAALMAAVAARIEARGEAAILHTYADNAGAIALYERSGYRLRARQWIIEIARE